MHARLPTAEISFEQYDSAEAKALKHIKVPDNMNMKNILSHFFQGLLYVVPIAVTVYVIYTVVAWADSIFSGIPFVGRVPGLGLVLVLAVITLAGYFGGTVFAAPAITIFNRTLAKAPFIKLIYTSVRDLMKAFVGEKKKFDKPVLVQLDKDGLNNRLGFVTQDDLKSLGLDGMIAVYSPYPYSVMGDLIIVPAANVRPLPGVKSTDLMKMIVSGGVSLPGEGKSENVEKEEE